MEKELKNKRVLSIELDNDVKKVSITGRDSEEKVVMRQDLDEDDLEQVTGGVLNVEVIVDNFTSEYNDDQKGFESSLNVLWPDSNNETPN